MTNQNAEAGFAAAHGSAAGIMHTQIEQMGAGYIVRLRARDTVYLWAHLWTQADCRRWAEAHALEAEKMAARSLGVENASRARGTEPPNDQAQRPGR